VHAARGTDRRFGVGPQIPFAIVLLPNDALVTSGQTLQLTATVVDVAGREIPGEPITFTTHHPDVLTVSATGYVARTIGIAPQAPPERDQGRAAALAA
jgi:hypothetical protein